MYFEKPLYLGNTNSPLIYAWPSFVFFVGDTRNPLIYESGSPVDLTISLPQLVDGQDDPYIIEKHDIGLKQYQLSLPALCVTDGEYLSRVETLLYGAGLFPLIIEDSVFRIGDSFSLESTRGNEILKKHDLRISKMPFTMPIDSFSPIPYVDHQTNLIIPHACPPIWQWWNDGLSPGSIVCCFERIVPKEIFEKLQKDYPLHQKDQPPPLLTT